jgi:hypothetical protein
MFTDEVNLMFIFQAELASCHFSFASDLVFLHGMLAGKVIDGRRKSTLLEAKTVETFQPSQSFLAGIRRVESGIDVNCRSRR